MASGDGTLRGRCILLTRAAEQCAGLARALEARGAVPLLFPTLEIRSVTLSAASLAALGELSRCDGAFFISANAVHHGLPQVAAWPPGLPAFAVGEATARALMAHAVAPIVTPQDGADSEALLRLPELARVEGRRFVIFRGVGGREVLARTLRERGARVDYVESYERRMPMSDPAPVLRLCDQHGVHAVCASSSEALENLYGMAGEPGAACLRQLPLFVSHPRQAGRARELGAARVILCDAGDGALLSALEAHFATEGDGAVTPLRQDGS